MKKFTIILAALFAANMVSAQIYLEKTVNGRLSNWLSMDDYYFDCGKLPIVYGDTLVELYNDDMTLYKSVRFASNPKAPNKNSVKRSPSALMGGPMSGMYLFARNVYTTDGKIAFVRWYNYHLTVYDEDGQMIFDLQDMSNSTCGIFPVNGKWKLVIQKEEWNMETLSSTYTSYIYSLPGNGDTSVDVMSPISPRRSATRKYLHNDQVLIENAEHTYTMQGQEVK